MSFSSKLETRSSRLPLIESEPPPVNVDTERKKSAGKIFVEMMGHLPRQRCLTELQVPPQFVVQQTAEVGMRWRRS